MQLDVQAAMKAGATPQQISGFLQQNPHIQAPGFSSPDQTFGSGLIGNILNPINRFAGNALGAGYELFRGAKSALGDKNAYVDPQGNTVQNPFLTEQQLSAFDSGKGSLLDSPSSGLNNLGAQLTNPNSGAIQGLKDTANVASYAIPFGKGSGLLQKALLPGAIAGGLQGISQENATLESVAKSALIGGAGAGVLNKVLGVGNLVSKAEEPLNATADKVLQSQYSGAGKVALKNLKVAQVIPELAEYGVKNINDVAPVAEKVTGQNGVISKLTRKAVSLAGRVNTDGLLQKAEDLAADPSILGGQDNKFVAFVKKGLSSLYETGGPIENATSGNPSATFDLIKSLEGRAADLGSGNASKADKALAGAYRQFAGELQDRLFTGAGADNVAIDLAKQPEFLKTLSDISPKLAEKAAAAKTLGELRSIAAPFVKGSQLAELVAQNPGKAIGAKDLLAGGLAFVGSGGNPLVTGAAIGAEKLASTPRAQVLLSDALRGAANIAGKVGPKLAASPATQTAAGVLGSRIPSLLPQSGSFPNGVTDANANTNGNSYNQANQSTSSSSVPQITRAQVQAAALYLPPAIADRVKAAYEAQQGDTLQQARSDVSYLTSNALNMLKSGKGQTGPIAPKLQEILGTVNQGDQPTLTLNNTIANIKASIAKARAGTSFTPNEEKLLDKYTPNVGDSKQQLETKLNGLQQFFGRYQ
jgi:hypothetical protein